LILHVPGSARRCHPLEDIRAISERVRRRD
jgi:hypothetical protein